MSNRDAFLARVRKAAEQGRQYRVHLRQVPDEIGYIGAAGDLCEQFAAEVNAVGGQAFVVADLAAAAQQLQSLLAEAGAQSAACWKHELLDRLGLAELLAAAGVQFYDHDQLAALAPSEQRRLLLACDVGITSCDCVIAETGTLMMCSRPGQERVASLLPPMHIAVVERQQIVPDLIDAFTGLGSGFRVQGSGIRESAGESRQELSPPLPLSFSPPHHAIPSNVTFITGPSKTGDIELQLTTGVHGPGKWRVIVIQ
jgi:L-lactate dehydrogenase complex protein LldG